MEQPTTATVQVPATIVQSTMPVSNTDTLCGELVYCGYAPAGFEMQPINSSRCDQLDTLRMQNDQKVMQCLKNPNESSGNTIIEKLHFMQGIGAVEDCPGYGIKSDRDNGLAGSGNDESGRDRSIQQTTDGGYIVSGGINGEGSPGHGEEDMWVVKLNPAGTVQWQKVLGGSGREESFSIYQTTDGGYISTGYTTSNNSGDVGSNHGGYDVWVVKLNSNGDIQWQTVLGGNGDDSGFSILQTTDGGYILTGITDSDNNGDVGKNYGGYDVWVVKLHTNGNVQWQTVLGGNGDDSGFSILQTTYGEYILTGITDSDNNGDVGKNHGGNDVWVVKINPGGIIQWQTVLGGDGDDSGFSIQPATDGGYILTGITDSDNNGDVGANHGGYDVWVVKINPGGIIQWQKVLGGNGDDSGFSIQQATDGGYILTGITDSDNNGDVGKNHGGYDVWVVKLYTNGNIQWQKVFGGNGDDSGFSIQQTTNGEYIFTGITDSDNNGDVGANHGGYDVWVVKINPIGTIQWQTVLGGDGDDSG